ncbi:hypothetical protein N665_0206s0069 [Sinapis alba]|nr:hypothetical protein N665_0206s0069 [Sinapis alba]
MDFSLFLNIVAAAIGFILIFRKLIKSHQENKEFDTSSSSSTSSPPSSLSISSVPQSSSSHVWIHDVFPSFRGEDIRKNFLSHIQKEFKRKGITLFNDNGIKRGESIAPELIRGIRGSKIAIILLSTNYASSKWCLEELVEIMKCREELGQTVMAIFYKVDPSDVKKLTGDFGKVFRKTCEGQAKEDICRWKQALEKVATLAGYHSSNCDFKDLVGMEAHMKKMEPFLLLGSNEVRIIGIWGPSGIGKSTIARVLFSRHSHEFQLSVFMENIKRHCPRPCSDEYSAKLQLQEKFLSKIINQEDIKIHHLGVAPDRLRDKRVLVVLDDVDHLMQLDAMAKDHTWFGPGSRIIITTQDKKILTAHGINHIYKVEYPGFRDALEIFCMYAFGQKSPYDGFEKLAWEVKEFAGNIPLGLKVMGSYFKGMLKHEWEEELPRLRTRLDGEIESSLKLRYDDLCVDSQDLFLHLACLFNNEQIEKVEEYLARNFVGVKGQLRVLAEKSFISVDGGYIKIHDLLALFGREIVRKQSIHDPGQRQFLADVGDICQVLRNETLGSGSVIGIDLKLLELKMELKISDRAFERMYNVQFLRFLHSDSDSDSDSDSGRPKQTCHHSIDLMTCLPPNLRLLHWDFFPMTCLPSNFISEFLVEIALRKSNYLEKLWEGNKVNMNLHGCSNLAELPFSIGNVISLRRLNLSHCSRLLRIPPFIWDLVNLGRLDFSHCSSLVRLPSASRNAIIKLKVLDLSGCTSLMELPSSMENATDLEELDLTGCLHLAKLPSGIGNLKKLYLKDCSSLVELPSSIRNSFNLEDFTFSGCSTLLELPFYLGNATDLKKIDLSGCSSLRELPSSIGKIDNLLRLALNECSSLVELPSSIGNISNLTKLHLNGCSSLVELPSSIGNMNNLWNLYLNGCSSLVELPSSIGNMKSLMKLYLNGCSSLVELPSSIGNINHLRKLALNGCSSLVELPSSIGNMNNLKKLYLERCSKLKALPININMKSLDILVLTDCSSLKSFHEISTNIRILRLVGTAIQEIPPSIKTWPRLRELHLPYFENLKKYQHALDRITKLHLSDTRIQEIAPWVKERSRLRELVIKGCTKLVSLPQLPDSLKFLVADNCGSLERLDCSFNKKKFNVLSFVNCFKLNQEARDLIINTSTRDFAIFPGETVPTYFTYRATGSSLSMTWNGLDTQFPTALRLKACLLLVYKGDVDAGDWCWPEVSYCIKDKLNGVKSGYYSSFSPIQFYCFMMHSFYTFFHHAQETPRQTKLTLSVSTSAITSLMLALSPIPYSFMADS